jgi:hypothetical protein
MDYITNHIAFIGQMLPLRKYMDYITNHIAFKGTTQAAVVAAIRAELPLSDCFVEKEKRGWVVVADKECNEALGDPVVKMAGTVCCACECPAISLSEVNSDYLCYWVFDEKGNLVDSSRPETAVEPMPDEARYALLGKPASIAALVSERGVTEEAVRAALCAGKPEYMEISEKKLFKLLGIKTTLCGYKPARTTAEAMDADPTYPTFVGQNWRDQYVWIRPDVVSPGGG